MKLAALIFLLIAMVARAEDSLVRQAEKTSLAGKYAEAETLARQVLALPENAGGQSDDAASAYEILAKCGYALGKSHAPETRQFALQSASIREKLHGPNHMSVGTSLYWMASILAMDGLNEEAVPIYERVISIYDASGARNDRLPAALGALANVKINQGDPAAAIPLFDRGLRLLAKAGGAETRTSANLLTNQALAFRLLGNTQSARSNNLRALTILEKVVGPHHMLLVIVLKNLGTLHVTLNEPRQAAAYLERALALIEENKQPSFWATGSILESLGQAKAMLGERAEARTIMEKAVARHRDLYGNFHPNLMVALPNLAILRARDGELSAALQHALESVAIARHYVANEMPTLSEREALLNAANCKAGLQVAISILAVRPDSGAKAVLDALVRERAQVFDEMARRRRALGESGDPALQALAAELRSAREELAKVAVTRDPGNGLVAAVDRKERAERAMAAKNARFRRELTGQRAGLAEVVAALPAGAALVSFVRYDQACLDAKASCLAFSPNAPQAYLALVTRAGRGPVAVPLAAASIVDGLVTRLRKQISEEAAAPGVSVKRSVAAYREAASALRQRVWDPLTPAIGDARIVFIVPDGSLHLVNFAALPVGESSYLVERGPVLHTLSAERDLVSGESAPRGQGLLAMGDPSFSATPRTLLSSTAFRGTTSKCASFPTVQFGPLAATGKEVDQIAAIWKGTGAGEARVLKRESATEAAFKREAAGKRILHLASHGFFLPDCGPGRVENPLLLSGLALAGANQRSAAPADAEDGILTAEEIAAMDLSGVEWAVLSACETGVGEIKESEGVFGLRRAMQVAGARTVMMSLWPVEDRSAGQWMRAVYAQRLKNGLPSADAVREASLSVLRQRRQAGLSPHPWYWAGFVAAGDWR